MDYAVSKMKEYQKMALAILQKYPDSTYKESLELMVNYVIERKKWSLNLRNTMFF